MAKIYSWNVNGIRAVLRKGALDDFLEKHDPDVLCLQETKAHKDQVPVDFPNYTEYWCSAERKGYSGTAIFSKKPAQKMKCGFPQDIVEQFNLEDEYGDTTTEGRITTVEYETCFIVCVYTPNAKDNLGRLQVRTEWDSAFRAYVEQLNAQKPVIFCGDLNVAHTEDDLARPKQNEGNKGFTKEERSGIAAHIEAGFIDTFRMFTEGNGYYTWWSHWGGARERNVGWRIDYIFIAKSLSGKVKDAQIHPDIMGSDHCPTSIDIDIPELTD